jgi:hypothetical protein
VPAWVPAALDGAPNSRPPFLGSSGGRKGGCFSGEDVLSLSASALFRLGRREGVLCIPDGGVLTTGSGCSGVGGSSGSGTTTSGSTPRDAPGRMRPDIAFNNSSSTSGAGGGSGLGVGLVGVLPGPGRLAGDRRTLSPSDPARAPPSRVPERSSIWVLIARVKLPVLSGVAAREAEGGASGEDRSRLGWLSRRLRTSGLYRLRLARVGEANDGRLGDDPAGGRASRDVVDSGSGCTGTAVRGDVLRLLGAEVSIAAQLCCPLYAHSRGQCRREISIDDASKRVFCLVVSRSRSDGGDRCFVWEVHLQGVWRTVRLGPG